MSVSTYEREEVALLQLETALRLWDEGRDHFSVLTLAGAAEEILGKHLARDGKSTALELRTQETRRVYEVLFNAPLEDKEVHGLANWARNSAKHFDADSSPTITLDPREEAREMLGRAISNFIQLGRNPTDSMLRFVSFHTNEQRAKKRER